MQFYISYIAVWKFVYCGMALVICIKQYAIRTYRYITVYSGIAVFGIPLFTLIYGDLYEPLSAKFTDAVSAP